MLRLAPVIHADPPAVPLRPRLSDHVVARWHRRGADEQVVLVDTRCHRAYVLGVPAWTAVSCADGTRDLEGVTLAVQRLGERLQVGQVRSLLVELHRAGLVEDGPPRTLLGGVVATAAPDDRSIEVMPHAAYRCDGRGGCCRSYGTVAFLPGDVDRACATLPERQGAAHRRERMFLPLYGSAPQVIRAVLTVDGACAYLDDDGACALHRAAGPATKPVGCQWFPVRLVDDGVQVRAAPAIECLCVARPQPDGDPLLAPGVNRVCDLPLGITVGSVPATVAIRAGVEVPRAQAVELVDRSEAFLLGDDPLLALWTWGQGLATARPGRVAMKHDALVEDLRPVFAAIAGRVAARLEVERLWRGADDMMLTRMSVVELAARVLSSAAALHALLACAPIQPEVEAHVLRSSIFGRTWLLHGSLREQAREQAVHLALARAMPSFVPDHADPTLKEAPLAVVQGVGRGFAAGES